ncbi:hypothetical protein B14911_24761 [Bacillus sp. NRRL B-14911]|nr:hypothetical protein B14911_24761 [Bacillus sp. NRRL B-14911]
MIPGDFQGLEDGAGVILKNEKSPTP